MSFHVLFFFFKQQTEYDMRISDWSSDVCSSDLRHVLQFAFNTRLRLVLDKHRPTAQYFRIEFSLARAIAAHRIDMHAGFKHVGLKHLRVYMLGRYCCDDIGATHGLPHPVAPLQYNARSFTVAPPLFGPRPLS